MMKYKCLSLRASTLYEKDADKGRHIEVKEKLEIGAHFCTQKGFWRILDINKENMTALVISVEKYQIPYHWKKPDCIGWMSNEDIRNYSLEELFDEHAYAAPTDDKHLIFDQDSFDDFELYYEPWGYSARLDPPFSVGWKECSLREWLNGKFLQTSFTKEEKEAILETRTEKTNESAKENDDEVYDRIFLLSWEEYQKYFKKKGRPNTHWEYECFIDYFRARSHSCELVTPCVLDVSEYYGYDVISNTYEYFSAWRTSYLDRRGDIIHCYIRPAFRLDMNSTFFQNLIINTSSGEQLISYTVRIDTAVKLVEQRIPITEWNGLNAEQTQSLLQRSREVLSFDAFLRLKKYEEQQGFRNSRVSIKKMRRENLVPGAHFRTKNGDLWHILDIDIEKNIALVILESSVYEHPYHYTDTTITWERCDLRRILNTEFYLHCFTETEKEAIIESDLDNSYYDLKLGIYRGNKTQDKIFILSAEEAEKYYDPLKQLLLSHDDWWWLRTPGSDSGNEKVFSFDRESEYPVNRMKTGDVHPAFRVDLNSVFIQSLLEKDENGNIMKNCYEAECKVRFITQACR